MRQRRPFRNHGSRWFLTIRDGEHNISCHSDPAGVVSNEACRVAKNVWHACRMVVRSDGVHRTNRVPLTPCVCRENANMIDVITIQMMGALNEASICSERESERAYKQFRRDCLRWKTKILGLVQRAPRMMYIVHSRFNKFRQPHELSITSTTITDGHQNNARDTCVRTSTTLPNGFRQPAV